MQLAFKLTDNLRISSGNVPFGLGFTNDAKPHM